MAVHIVNPDPRFSKVALIEPRPFGYIHIAASVRPGPLPFVLRGRRVSEFLGRLKTLARQLEAVDSVLKATVYHARAIAPLSSYLKSRRGSIHVARFDVVVLVETPSPATAREVRGTPAYQALLDAITAAATDVHVMVARNIKRVADVDKTRQGIFLFNYFVGDDPTVVVDLWDYLAGWYAVETGLDNSTLLAPLEGERADYVIVNHARWEGSLPGVLLSQFTKRSFRSYVLANLDANRVGAMPVLYRLA
jgi:hypothetical protein